MNPKNRKPKPPVDAPQPVKNAIELTQAPEILVPGSEVETMIQTAVNQAEGVKNVEIAKLKKELADANSVLGRQRSDLENLRQKADADKTVIAGLKTELNKLNAFGKWLYGITY
jgi:molecular chaperone GrpE (heat shock protein)